MSRYLSPSRVDGEGRGKKGNEAKEAKVIKKFSKTRRNKNCAFGAWTLDVKKGKEMEGEF
jgi:hypothetical protein